MDDNLRQAVLGAGSIQAPAPVFASSLGPEISQLNAAGFQLPQSSGATSALANQSQDIVAAQKEAAARAEADAKANAKYKKTPKADGGFTFTDPDGNEISAAEYARANDISVTDALKNSYNPIDKRFAQDYKQLQNYINDKANAKNDPKARSRAQAVETQVRKLYNIKLHQQDPTEVFNAFMAAYPTVFGGSGAGRQRSNSLFPTDNQLNNSTSLGGGGL